MSSKELDREKPKININNKWEGFFITEDPFHFKYNLDKPLIRFSISKALLAKNVQF